MDLTGVRWETLGLVSSPVAFESCWTKQWHSARAGDPSETSTALGTQQTASVLLALSARVGTSISIWVVPQQALRDVAWKLIICSPGALFTSSPDLPLLWHQCLQPWGCHPHYTGQKGVCHPSSDVGTLPPLWHAAQALQFSLSPVPPGSPGQANQARSPAVVCTWLWRRGQGHGTWIAALQNPNTLLVHFFTSLQRDI